jgi:RNA 3'-terminal phosphate cyclase
VVFVEGQYEYIQYGNAQIAYDSSTVSTEVAQKLHQFWMSKGGYDNKSGDVLLLEKAESGSWIVKAPVFTGAETNPKIVGSFKLLGANMKSQVFNN